MTLRLAFLALLVATTMAVTPALAGDDHDHGSGAHDHATETGHFKVTPPATVKEAWALLVSKAAESDAALGENKVDIAHQAGEHIEAAVHTLQEKSDMVPADAKSKLSSALKQLDKAADEMHHGAEEKNTEEAAAALSKIKSLIPVIEKLYPTGELK